MKKKKVVGILKEMQNKYDNEILLLKKQMNEKTRIIQQLNSELERLNAR